MSVAESEPREAGESGAASESRAAGQSSAPGRRATKRRWKLARYAIAAVGMAVLAVAASRLDGRALLVSLREMNPALGVAAMLVMIVGKVGAKALRSQWLLAAECRRVGCAVPLLATTARLLAASHAAGQLAWGPLGFTVRTVAWRADGIPLGAIARVHVAERIAEAVGIAAVGIAALVLVPMAGGAMPWATIGGSRPVGLLVIGGGVLLAAAIAIAVTAAVRPGLRRRWVARLPSGAAFGKATLWALVSSVADIAVLGLAARAVHVDAGIAPLALAFLAVNGACVLPVTPAQLGVQEAAIAVAFATAGIPAPAALACALAYRCAHLVPLALVGVPALIATWAPARGVAPRVAPRVAR